jgi:hypothetical protein
MASIRCPVRQLTSTVEHPSAWPEGFPFRGDGGGRLAALVVDTAAVLLGGEFVRDEFCSVVVAAREGRLLSVFIRLES